MLSFFFCSAWVRHGKLSAATFLPSTARSGVSLDHDRPRRRVDPAAVRPHNHKIKAGRREPLISRTRKGLQGQSSERGPRFVIIILRTLSAYMCHEPKYHHTHTPKILWQPYWATSHPSPIPSSSLTESFKTIERNGSGEFGAPKGKCRKAHD